jgi:hypothetical protein
MNPVSAPLARIRDVNHIRGRLAVRDTALGDTDGAVVPSRLVRIHTMVVERTRVVKIVRRVHDERVIDADGDRRGTRSLHKKVKRERGRKTNGQVPLTPIARLGTPRPSGLMS